MGKLTKTKNLLARVFLLNQSKADLNSNVALSMNMDFTLDALEFFILTPVNLFLVTLIITKS
jgi:hypothetical protein